MNKKEPSNMNHQRKIEFFHSLKKNRLIRKIATPYMKAKYRRALNQYAESLDSKFVQTLRGTHIGERCFIIGNGPSLVPADLEMIKNEYSFAFNRIYYMFDRTDWRPSCYMCVDHSVIDLNYREIERLDAPVKLLDLYAKKYHYKDARIHYLCCENIYARNSKSDRQISFSEELSTCYCAGGTVTYTAIQMAVYMGFSEIYLLGVDHSYSVMQKADGSIQRDNSAKNYFEGLHATGITLLNVDVATAAYQKAKAICESKGIRIYNATRGGKLDVFERIELDTVIKNATDPAEFMIYGKN